MIIENKQTNKNKTDVSNKTGIMLCLLSVIKTNNRETSFSKHQIPWTLVTPEILFWIFFLIGFYFLVFYIDILALYFTTISNHLFKANIIPDFRSRRQSTENK